jgi:menaquinone-dependent protoporphyrinogen oxidase
VSQNVLVTYATKTGATAAVAAAVGKVLSARGLAVTVKPITAKLALDGYQAVVIGSPIRVSSWLPEVVQFIRANRARLSQLPTAIFTVHRLNAGDDAASQKARLAYTAPVRQFLTPQAEVFFTGAMDFNKLSFVDRLLAKPVDHSSPTGAGEDRDWDKMRGWAQSILA